MTAFTSDLSVADFALCRQLGLRPLSQVMGSSIYQVGYQEAGPLGYSGVNMTELLTLSQAWNQARDLAFGRLRDEAARLGAGAVVGVDVRSGASQWGEAGTGTAIEYNVFGTAVELKSGPSGPPALTDLPVADYSKLIASGIEPVGVVAWTSVFFVSWSFNLLLGRPVNPAPTQNFEQRHLTQCFYTAREQVMSEVSEQARRLDASGIVGVQIGHNAHSHSVRSRIGEDVSGIMITMSAIGTAIRGDAAHAHAGAHAHAHAGAHAHTGTRTHDGTPPSNHNAFPRPKLKIDLLS